MADPIGDDNDENLVDIISETLAPDSKNRRSKGRIRTIWRLRRYRFNASWKKENISTELTIVDHKLYDKEDDLQIEEWGEEEDKKSIIRLVYEFIKVMTGL